MTLDELVTDVTALLDTALTCDVSAYQRIDPPSALRVQVIEGADGEEGEHARDMDNVAGGTHYQRMHLCIIVEAPWDEKLTTATSICDTVETIKGVIFANRDIAADDGDDAAVGRYDGQRPFFASYPGHANTWIKGRYVLASWRV